MLFMKWYLNSFLLFLQISELQQRIKKCYPWTDISRTSVVRCCIIYVDYYSKEKFKKKSLYKSFCWSLYSEVIHRVFFSLTHSVIHTLLKHGKYRTCWEILQDICLADLPPGPACPEVSTLIRGCLAQVAMFWVKRLDSFLNCGMEDLR